MIGASVAAYEPKAYGEVWAAEYDELFPAGPNVEEIATFVTDFAAGGRVLEFGIGSGRVALELAPRGVEVHGIDASQAMVERLRSKPGGADIPVVIGDMTSVRVNGEFAVVLLVFNTIFALPTQDAQIACFRNAARHLAEEGVFVIECFVPDPARFDRGQRVQARDITDDEVRLDVAEHDPTTQTIRSALVRLRETGTRILPVTLRYAWPSELDLMGRLADLRLLARWGGWRRQPFSASSTSHVSVYTPTMRPAGGQV